MLSGIKKFALPLCWVSIFGAQAAFGNESVDNWTIAPAGDGKAVTMTYANPATYLKTESDIELSVDASGAATSGAIHFKDGVQRPMTPGEMSFYYVEYSGNNAYWDYRQKQGGVESYDFAANAIPQNFVGQQVRAFSKAGKNYIGVLSLLPSSPDWFTLNIRGSSMMFYKNAVQRVQMLK